MSDLQQGRTYLTVHGVATFGERLGALLEETAVSGEELARRLEVDSRQVRRWRNSPTAPRFETIKEIARALGVSLDRFAEEEESAATAPPVDSGALDVLVERRRHPRVAGGQGQP